MIHVFRKLIQAADTTPTEHRRLKLELDAQLGTWMEEPVWTVFGHMQTALLTHAFHTTPYVQDRAFATIDVTVSALAVERYRLKYETYPERLDNVAPEYLESVPLDLFAEGPLRFQKSENGFTIYNICYDFVDDGGTPLGQVDDSTWKGDIVFSVDRGGMVEAQEEVTDGE
jgi:hypothetical protein